MIRKETLKQIAQRCMDGDVDGDFKSKLYYCLGDYLPSHYDVDVTESLDAAAALEAELLPDGWMIDVALNAKMTVSRTFKVIGNECKCTSEATAPTEPLARLAALCLALDEMDEFK